jgi:hypothetical protein
MTSSNLNRLTPDVFLQGCTHSLTIKSNRRSSPRFLMPDVSYCLRAYPVLLRNKTTLTLQSLIMAHVIILHTMLFEEDFDCFVFCENDSVAFRNIHFAFTYELGPKSCVQFRPYL